MNAVQKLVQTSVIFLKKNSSTILTVAGCIGVVTTAVLAAKEAPEALDSLEDAQSEKEEELTTFEKVKIVGKVYLPTIISGAASVACILGAHASDKKKVASFAGLYSIAAEKLRAYQEKTKEVVGEETESNIRSEVVEDIYQDTMSKDNPCGIGEPLPGEELFFEEWSGRFFWAKMETVLEDEIATNKLLANEGYALMNDHFINLGLAEEDPGNYFGWEINQMEDEDGACFIDFIKTPEVLHNGVKYTSISYNPEPQDRYSDGYCC